MTVAGRVLGGEPRALSISDPSGVSVPLRAKLNDGMSYAGDGTLDAVLETNANGEFRLIHVPYGPHTVSVGTRAGLLRGESMGDFSVDFQPGMKPLELSLPPQVGAAPPARSKQRGPK